MSLDEPKKDQHQVGCREINLSANQVRGLLMQEGMDRESELGCRKEAGSLGKGKGQDAFQHRMPCSVHSLAFVIVKFSASSNFQ